MKRIIITTLLILIYLSGGLLIMGTINPITEAKWSDGGFDLIYGSIVIYLSMLLFYAYKLNKNKQILRIFGGFWVIIVSRIIQIFLQELHLKTNYQLSILPWSWAVADLIMIIGFVFIVRGLWGVKYD